MIIEVPKAPQQSGGDLARVRARLKLSRRAMASVLMVSQSTVYRWETDQYAIPRPYWRLIQLLETKVRPYESPNNEPQKKNPIQ